MLETQTPDHGSEIKDLAAQLLQLTEKNKTLEKNFISQKQTVSEQQKVLKEHIQEEMCDLKAEIRKVEKKRTVLELTAQVAQQPDIIHQGEASCSQIQSTLGRLD